VGVLGCGLMGFGIAQVCAQSGHDTMVLEVSKELLDKGLGNMAKFLAGGVERGKMTAEDRDRTLSNLKGTTNPADLADRDLIIEAVIENLESKRAIFAKLDLTCQASTMFASNTSSLSITELAAGTKRPQRFIGLHFFNPVPLMKLVEVVRTIMTDDQAYKDAVAFVGKLGKTAIRTSDKTGFIVNRLLVPYILDAIRAYEEGVGTIEEIDEAMKLGCGHPMGPFTLLDFVGLDTTYYIANVFFEEFRERRFASPPLLKRMVMAGFSAGRAARDSMTTAGPNRWPIACSREASDVLRQSPVRGPRENRVHHRQPPGQAHALNRETVSEIDRAFDRRRRGHRRGERSFSPARVPRRSSREPTSESWRHRRRWPARITPSTASVCWARSNRWARS